MFFKHFLRVSAFCWLPLSLANAQSSGTIVEDTNIVLENTTPLLNLNIYQTVSSDLDTGDATCFDLLAVPGANSAQTVDLFGGEYCLDEGSDWYIATAGQTFSRASIAAGDFRPVGGSISPGEVPGFEFPDFPDFRVLGFFDSLSTGQFYLAVASTGEPGYPGTGRDGGEFNPIRNVFGWALFDAFQNDDFSITVSMLDNAVAYGTGNIIVGQNAFAVPEPSSATLVALFGVGFLHRRRR